MKLDVVSLLGGKKAELSARKGKVAPGFEVALRAQTAAPSGKTQVPAPDEKKPRSVTGTEEALLVARTLQAPARSIPLFVTKPPELKAAPADPAKVAATPAAPVTLDQLASRAKVHKEPLRVTGPTEKKPTRAEAPAREAAYEAIANEKKKLDEPALTTAPQAPQPTAAEPFRVEAPAPVQDAKPLAPVAPLLMEDASARVVLMPTIARMSVDTGDAAPLNVQLRVRDGVTEIAATGPAAPLLEARQGELRVALAKEGLALGHFDLTQSGSQHRHSERPDPDAAITPANVRRSTSTSSSETATEDGRVHVKA